MGDAVEGVRSAKVVFDGYMRLSEVCFESVRSGVVTRVIEDHGCGAMVLPYDPVRLVALLLKQERLGVMFGGFVRRQKVETRLLEAPAGRCEQGSLEDCARREALEESGLSLRELDEVVDAWSVPGLSTERMKLFLASYSSSDRVGPGGGVAEEGEYIDLVELPLAELARLADCGEITDVKTFALVQTLRVRRPDLFRS